MSRIGKHPIPVPSGVDVTIDGAAHHREGPEGHPRARHPRRHHRPPGRRRARWWTRPDDERQNRALHGLVRSLVNNMVVGVYEEFAKELEIIGVGYRAAAQGTSKLELAARLLPPGLGRRPRGHHASRRPAPNRIIVKGIDKQTRRPGGRQHPQDPQARALQGQGHPVRRRARPPRRPGSRRSKGRRHDRQRTAQAGSPPPASPPGAQEGARARPSGRASPCSARTSTSTPR